MATTVTAKVLSNEVGESIPPHTAHAVSVSLPTWKANIGYEEGEDWVMSKMKTGYPRFFIHKSIEAFAEAITQRHGSFMQKAFLFPSPTVSARCAQFIRDQAPSLTAASVRIIDLYPNAAWQHEAEDPHEASTKPIVSAVLFPRDHAQVAKTFWQHSGDGISSRRAEYCHKAFSDGRLSAMGVSCEKKKDFGSLSPSKGPRRYQMRDSVDIAAHKTDDVTSNYERKDSVQFVEERFGRNLNVSLAANAKIAIRRRIAGTLTENVDLNQALEMSKPPARKAQVEGFSEDDVYLYPCGMSSIFNTHRTMMACKGPLKSISYGFPYIDTLKILEKWGPGCLFYGHGSSKDLEDLERRCEAGEKYLALFCEFPGNPLLQTPDLCRIRSLADRYDFAVVVDETIGNFVNVHVLPYADVVVSSLTKVFTGECNVMGGSSVLNPQSRYYAILKQVMKQDYEDNYWPEDAIYMERNSRDFISRIDRINTNAEAICEKLKAAPIVKEVYYPKYSATRKFYDQCRNADKGYGGLLSVTLRTKKQAVIFFDELDTAKGPSLGTNFTLSSPYVILAHYRELEWTAQFGVDVDLIRISVGLEDSADLVARIERALAAASRTVDP